MKRIGLACCSVAVVLVLGLAVTAQVAGPAESVPVSPTPPGAAFQDVSQPKQDVSQPKAVPVNGPVKYCTDGIDDLLDKLAAITAQKDEPGKVEKQTVAQRREKLKHQKERLRKLGVEPQDAPPAPAVPATPVTTSELPAPEKPW